MMRTLTEADGKRALRDHLLERAETARAKHGGMIDGAKIVRMLDDREVVRYPTGLRFDAGLLKEGEFGWAMPLGDHPSKGFCVVLHPCFENRPEDWPWLIAYHLPTINYGDIVEAEDCEAFGAALLGEDVERYYERLCALADSLPGVGDGAA